MSHELNRHPGYSDSQASVTRDLCLIPQEQHDQLKRQLQQAVTREAELRGSLDTYKTEHMQLLTANAQLVEKCQGLNRRVQVSCTKDACRWLVMINCWRQSQA